MRVAHVILDIATRQLDTPFDYLVPENCEGVHVGSCVLVRFSGRMAVGYVVGLAPSSAHIDLNPVEEVLGGPYFDEVAVDCASWISREYVCPLSEALRLFTPPGATPRVVRTTAPDGDGTGWILRRPGVGPVDDRWVWLADSARSFVPRKGATTQRAVIDALDAGPVRVAELSADLGSVSGALRALERAGVVHLESRRRFREVSTAVREAPRHSVLTAGQKAALEAIDGLAPTGGVLLIDGVTGSGKTEVYLRAIERVRLAGGSACVLVPEISLTPQTVGRFRSRFGDEVAVLHSRLSPGERFDQWDRVLRGDARIVVGARSALFAPLPDLALIVIDEEHETSYKQGSAPRYHTRDVAARLAQLRGATLVLGSASPSMESRARCAEGEWIRVAMPDRVLGSELPRVAVVDLADEFARGNRSMFSAALATGLAGVRVAAQKAVLFLNRRGFASFLLCRECGFVPMCDSCTTSMTYHDASSRLACHHCGATRAVPSECPRCQSPYLRQFGAGTERVESELRTLFPDWPVVRMDSDTTKGKGAHERLLAEFEALESGVLLGTQMIAKGLDYPEVTLVGVIAADVTLNIPDFRAGERTYQLLEQVAGRAGRGKTSGQVIVQTYWPDHPAIVAAARHDPAVFYEQESRARESMGYPPYGRLANVLIWGTDKAAVIEAATRIGSTVSSNVPSEWQVLGPSPAPLARLKGAWRWHLLVKGPRDADIPGVVAPLLGSSGGRRGVSVIVDVDPVDLL